jgi:hypothetical protein
MKIGLYYIVILNPSHPRLFSVKKNYQEKAFLTLSPFSKTIPTPITTLLGTLSGKESVFQKMIGEDDSQNEGSCSPRAIQITR